MAVGLETLSLRSGCPLMLIIFKGLANGALTVLFMYDFDWSRRSEAIHVWIFYGFKLAAIFRSSIFTIVLLSHLVSLPVPPIMMMTNPNLVSGSHGILSSELLVRIFLRMRASSVIIMTIYRPTVDRRAVTWRR